MRSLPWLEDFNTHIDPDPAPEAPPPPQDEPDPRIEAWTEGFLAGRRAALADARHSQEIAAVLTGHVAAISQDLAVMADRSAATVGGLLLDVLAAALPPGWPPASLTPITEAIRPFFNLEPWLRLCPKQPGEMSFRDLPALYKALDSGDWDLAIRWHQAAADIDPAVIAGRLRQAITPAVDTDTVAHAHHVRADAPVPADPERPMVPPAFN